MRNIFILLLILFASNENIFSQKKLSKRNFIGKTFWTKFVLATDGNCRIEITPDDLSPTENNCGFESHIKADTEMKLIEMTDDKNWAKLTFRAEQNEFDVLIKNNSKSNFQKSFDLAFSKRKISKDTIYASCNIETKLDVIKKVGFPNEISRSENTEKWTFDANWIQFDFCGYDVTYIEFKNNKIISISGLI